MTILNSKELDLVKLVAILILALLFFVKNRQTNEKIDAISDNHLHTINETLQRIEAKLDDGFRSVNDKLSDVSRSVEIIKDRQKRK